MASPLCYSVDDPAKASGLSRSTIYLEIKAGRLEARKVGRRTIVLVPSAHAWLKRLHKPASEAAA